jgi:hypothetical protein
VEAELQLKGNVFVLPVINSIRTRGEKRTREVFIIGNVTNNSEYVKKKKRRRLKNCVKHKVEFRVTVTIIS